MKYEFPVINNIGDVLPAIEGIDEFIVSRRDFFTIIDYMVAFPETFPNPMLASSEEEHRNWTIRRECRGLKFSRNGDLLARPFHKFYNLNENEETRQTEVDWTQPFTIFEKLDGSMVHALYCSDMIMFATRMGLTDVACSASDYAESYQKHKIDYMDFCWDMIKKHAMTPIFEWCSTDPLQRIVVKHNKDKLVLTGLRDNLTGQYLTPMKMRSLAEPYKIPVVRKWGGRFEDIQSFVNYVKVKTDEEGYVLRFHNGHAIKTKNEWYVLFHKTKDAVRFEKDVMALYLTGKIDDLLPFLIPCDRERIVTYIEDMSKNLHASIEQIHVFVETQRMRLRSEFPDEPSKQKKAFADIVKEQYSAPMSALIFNYWHGKNVLEQIHWDMRNFSYSQGRVDYYRPLFRVNFNDYK